MTEPAIGRPRVSLSLKGKEWRVEIFWETQGGTQSVELIIPSGGARGK